MLDRGLRRGCLCRGGSNLFGSLCLRCKYSPYCSFFIALPSTLFSNCGILMIRSTHPPLHLRPQPAGPPPPLPPPRAPPLAPLRPSPARRRRRPRRWNGSRRCAAFRNVQNYQTTTQPQEFINRDHFAGRSLRGVEESRISDHAKKTTRDSMISASIIGSCIHIINRGPLICRV